MAMTLNDALHLIDSMKEQHTLISTTCHVDQTQLTSLRDFITDHLSAQAKVRVTNCGLPRELRLVCGHDSRSVDGCLHCEAADAIENSAASMQVAHGDVQPFIWFATDDNGSYGIGADRNSAISDLTFMARRVFPLYTHPAARLSQGAQGEAAKLDKPALVGHTQFGVGIAWSTVIGAAQRAYEWKDDKMSPEQIAAFYIAFPHLAPSHEKIKQTAERAAVPDGWVGPSALVRVNPEQMVRIAQNFAAADQDHSYTKVENFMPHDWVVAAMCAAYDAGRQNVIDGTHTEGFTQAALDRLAVAALEAYDATRWDRGMPANGLAKMRAAIAAVFKVDLSDELTASPQPPEGARVFPDEMLRSAYRRGFLSACDWPEPCYQDTDSEAYRVEREKALKVLLAAPALAGKEGS